MSTTAVFAPMEAGGFDFTTARKIIAKLEGNGLTIYKKKMHKNPRRPAASEPMTPEKAKAIRAYYTAYPMTTQQEIANKFNVNIGRVNEALEG
jgi:transcription initiation factor IIE alpha subunit